MVAISFAACADTGPDLEVKRLVARCVQEPALLLQQYYGRARVVLSVSENASVADPVARALIADGQVVLSVSEKAPIEQILEAAMRNRKRELDTLDPKHRALVEARMREMLEWINANTLVSTAPLGPKGSPSITEVQLPSSDALNAKAKSLCIEIFRTWSTTQ